MGIYLPIAEMSVNIFVLLTMGAAVGFLSGLFGVGGGFLITPLLIFYNIPPAIAVATGANQVVASSFSGALAHFKRGTLDMKLGTVLLAGGIVGSTLGIYVFSLLRQMGQLDLLVSLLYVVLLGTVGGMMFVESVNAIRNARRGVNPNLKRPGQHNWIHRLPLKMRFRASKLFVSIIPVLVLGAAIGFLASIMGVGGGFIMVPAMIYLLKVPTNVVIGTSLFQIVVVSAYTTIVHAHDPIFAVGAGGLVMLVGSASLPAMAVLSLFLAVAGAQAQGPVPRAEPEPPANVESIQIGLSTDRISITSDFSGADLTIFGALDNADPLINRQGRYDVIVVLEGPARPVMVRRKQRILGVWMNTQSEIFVNVPVSYSVATTRVPQDITDPINYRQLALGADNIYIEPLDKDVDTATVKEFEAALRQLKKTTGLYSERIGGVQFLTQSLFRATLTLAPNVPVGTHKARAFLFRNGIFIKENSAQLVIVKAGFEQSVFRLAHEYSLLYGIFAAVLAVFTGWLGRIVFRRD
mgnify:CR=1 FL=1